MTENDSKDFLFTWKIKHFNFFSKIYCECFTSPVFIAKNLEDSEWKIHLFPRTISEDIECRLERIRCQSSHSNKQNISLHFQYQLASSNGVVLITSDKFSKAFQEGSCSEAYRIKELYDFIKEIMKYPDDILVFRCYMSSNQDSTSLISNSYFLTGCEVETDVSSHTQSYVWTFKFSNTDNWSIGKHIKLDDIPIEVTFKYIDDGIHIELFSTVSDDWTHHFTCDIELINAIGNQVVSGEGDFEFNNEHRIWKFPNFICKKNLEQAHCFAREEVKIKLNILRLYSFISKLNYYSKNLGSQNLDLNKTKLVIHSSGESGASSDTECLLYNCQHRFQNSIFDPTSSDAKLRVDNELFHAHKSLLAASSPVFSEMFLQSTEKNRVDIININDMEADTLKYLLEYIYTGILSELDIENTLNLLVASERYQVLPLSNKCYSFLKTNLSPTNVCRVLYIADMISHTYLKSHSLDYIVENCSKILTTPEWEYRIERNIHLATEALLKLSKKIVSVVIPEALEGEVKEFHSKTIA